MNPNFDKPSNNNEAVGNMGQQLLEKGVDLRIVVENTDKIREQRAASNKKPAGFYRAQKAYGDIVAETIKNIDGIRKGTHGKPRDIKEAVVQARNTNAEKVAHDEKLAKEKTKLLHGIAGLRIRAKQAEEEAMSNFTKQHIAESITHLQKQLQCINKKVGGDPTEDHKIVREVMARWDKKEESIKEEFTPPDIQEIAKGIYNHTKENKEMQKEMDNLNKQEQTTMKEEPPKTEQEKTSDKFDEAKALREEMIARQKEIGTEVTDDAIAESIDLEESLDFFDGKIKDSRTRSEARREVVLARQKELEGRDDTASKEERIELVKEMTSLEKRFNDLKKVKPLQTPYDLAMERLNEENETKRKGAGTTITIREGMALEDLSQKESGITPLEAIADSETESKKEDLKMPTLEVKRLEKRASFTEGELAILKERAEARKIELLENIDKQNLAVAERAEKIGVGEKIRVIGEWYREIPLRYKVLLGAAFFTMASASAVIGGTVGWAVGTAAFTGSTVSRILGGFGTAVTVEGLLTHSVEKDGRTISEARKKVHQAAAITMGILVGGGVVGSAVGNVFHEFFPVHEIPKGPIASPLPNELTENALSAENKGLAEIAQAMQSGDTEAIQQTEQTLGITHEEALKLINERVVAIPTLEQMQDEIKTGQANLEAMNSGYIVDVSSGDSVWKLAEQQLQQNMKDFDTFSVGQKAYFIDALKDRIAENPQHFGVASGNIDALAVGDQLDFKDIFNDKTFLTEQLQKMHELTPEQVAHIEHYAGTSTPEVTDVAPAHEIPPTHTDIPQPQGEVAPAHPDTPTMSPESMSSDQNIGELSSVSIEGNVETVVVPSGHALEEAGRQLHSRVTDMFGEKGFLGFGSVDGMTTPNWIDPTNGFANKTVVDLVQIDPEKMQMIKGSVGIENKDAVTAMRAYLDEVGLKSRVQPLHGEMLENYLKRASAMAIDKLTK